MTYIKTGSRLAWVKKCTVTEILRLYLQDILHRPADLALKSGLDRYLKDRILASARPVF